jgi:competence protein ComEA
VRTASTVQAITATNNSFPRTSPWQTAQFETSTPIKAAPAGTMSEPAPRKTSTKRFPPKTRPAIPAQRAHTPLVSEPGAETVRRGWVSSQSGTLARALSPHGETVQLPEISRRRALAYILVLLAAVTFAGRIAFHDERPAPAASPLRLRAAPAPPRKVVVHVVGQVYRPGLYSLPDGSRVNDALEKAGGAKPRAALELVNLAAPVADGQQILVPSRQQAAQAASGDSSAGAPGLKVHLNSATLEQLDQLPGVGPVTAQKILDYRTAHGSFGSVDELDAVTGIGPARLAELRDLVDL